MSIPNLVAFTASRAMLEARVPTLCRDVAKARLNKKNTGRPQRRGSLNTAKARKNIGRAIAINVMIWAADLLIKSLSLEKPADLNWYQLAAPVSPIMFIQAVRVQHCCQTFKARASTTK